MTQTMRFTKQALPIGDDEISVLVAEEAGQPKAVFMSYESFLELAATLFTAVEALKASGTGLDVLGGDDDEEELVSYPQLRAV